MLFEHLKPTTIAALLLSELVWDDKIMLVFPRNDFGENVQSMTVAGWWSIWQGTCAKFIPLRYTPRWLRQTRDYGPKRCRPLCRSKSTRMDIYLIRSHKLARGSEEFATKMAQAPGVRQTSDSVLEQIGDADGAKNPQNSIYCI